MDSQSYKDDDVSFKIADPEFLALLEEKERRIKNNSMSLLFPDEGPNRRELYLKFLEFMEAGKWYKERALVSANRTGKTTWGTFESTSHLTGDYVPWWNGKVFNEPVRVWVCGKTAQTTRDILQNKLLGPPGQFGTGMIPAKSLVKEPTRKRSIANAVDECFVKHVSGGISICGFKSFDQGFETFMGTEQHVILLDEEPPQDVYGECLVRTMTTNGLIMLTFTPLFGLSEVVLSFLDEGIFPDMTDGKKHTKYVVNVDWDDVPHLTSKQKEDMLASMMPYEREARSKGIPTLGAGKIYPIPEEDIMVDDFEIPIHWPRAYGMDVGGTTAASWIAHDRESDTVYIYSVYKRGTENRADPVEPSIHADAIKARGTWIVGAVDPACALSLMQLYLELGLELVKADNKLGKPGDKEGGIYRVFQRLSTGRLKVFKSCQASFQEYRLYRRDKDGIIVKQNDHLMDTTRYAIMTGLDISRVYFNKGNEALWDSPLYEEGLSGRNPVTGY